MPTASGRTDPALLVLRIGVGGIFIAHGAVKVFQLGHAGVTGFFTKLGIPLPAVAAACIMALELLGGVLLVLGAGTRILATLFVLDTAGAILFAKRGAGFFAPNGFEFELLLLVGALALALAGAGAYSIDGARSRSRTPSWR